MRVRLNGHVKVRQEKLGTVIFDARGERVFVTNQTGGRALQLLLSGMEVDAVVHTLTTEYGSDEPTVRADVTGFVEQLLSRSLLIPAGQVG